MIPFDTSSFMFISVSISLLPTMPKVKTRKAVTKRVKVKKTKVLAMKQGQNHLNGKQTGAARRAKRKDTVLNVSMKNILRSINQ